MANPFDKEFIFIVMIYSTLQLSSFECDHFELFRLVPGFGGSTFVWYSRKTLFSTKCLTTFGSAVRISPSL
ncbi:hypothetical protein AB237_1905 [Acinetobacter baumannii NCGM 237]|nr:hypothetical protein AB237_1905 [Acinetobacter baumannii NCGM 237]